MNTCIFCNDVIECSSDEHIVPESFGNKHYILDSGIVCSTCNNRFSEYEMKALSNSVFIMERARKGVKTKKGKPVKGKVKELEVEGDENFSKDFINVRGLSPENFLNYDPVTKKASLLIKGFDKSEVATSKFLLKIGYEAIYKSQPLLLIRYDYQHLKDYLTLKTNNDWAFISRNVNELEFYDIPRYNDKFNLKNAHCLLQYCEFDPNTLLFKFKFGGIPCVISLLNRDIRWIKHCLKSDPSIHIFPEHFNKVKQD